MNLLLWLRLGLAAAVFGSGVWVGVQFEEGARDRLIRASLEAERDKAQAELEAERRNHLAGLEAVTTFLEAKVSTAKGRVTRVEIEKLVPVGCSVPGPAVGLLEAHRQGLPGDSGITAGSPAAGPVPGDLPLTALIHADADLADLYNLCREQVKAIRRAAGR